MKKRIYANVISLLANFALVYLCYTLCRAAFYLTNYATFGQLSGGYLLSLFGAGLVFDTSAIIYTNILFVVLFLFPLHYKEKTLYYKIVRWLFTVVNSLMIATNLADCVYFQFTGKRTTMSVFREFGAEAGTATSVFLSETASHWYLLLLAIVLGVLLYKGFCIPRYENPINRKAYYTVQPLALLLFAPLLIGGMRGGMTTATRPITLSNANQYVDRPIDAGMVLNTPFSLLRTIGKKSFVVPDYMPNEEMNRLYTALHQPTDTAQFRPMNVVVFIMESFSRQFSKKLNPDLEGGNYPGYTPFLDSLMEKGYTFEHTFSNGRKSIDGMPSVLSSIPSFLEPFFLTPAALNTLSSVAGELTRHKGYQSGFFHGAMNGSMGFQAFARAAGFESYWGRTEYNEDTRYHGDADFDGTWAIWDEEFLQFYCDQMNDFKEPFVTSVFTASSHSPFAVPQCYEGKFPQGGHPLFQCIGYSDNALRLFFEKAAQQPWFHNTLFVITADHTSGGVYPEYLTDMGYYSVPIVFYAPGMPALKGFDSEKLVNQIDIMPTILGLLGYDRPYVAFGQDVFHTPADETFTINYLPAGGVYQFAQGDYLIQFDGERVLHAYRFRTDKLMQHDVLSSIPAGELQRLEHKAKAIIQQYMQRMTTNQLVVTDSKE